MATFRVGQRVRFVEGNPIYAGLITPLPIGAQGTIIPHNGLANMISNHMADYCVSFDGDILPLRGVDSYQIEPLYDGHSKVSWSECLWQPNKENVSSVTAS